MSEAPTEKDGGSTERVWQALRASRGAWTDREDIGDGEDYVERIRQSGGCEIEPG